MRPSSSMRVWIDTHEMGSFHKNKPFPKRGLLTKRKLFTWRNMHKSNTFLVWVFALTHTKRDLFTKWDLSTKKDLFAKRKMYKSKFLLVWEFVLTHTKRGLFTKRDLLTRRKTHISKILPLREFVLTHTKRDGFMERDLITQKETYAHENNLKRCGVAAEFVTTCDMTYSYVWHDSFIRVTWLILTPFWQPQPLRNLYIWYFFCSLSLWRAKWLIHTPFGSLKGWGCQKGYHIYKFRDHIYKFIYVWTKGVAAKVWQQQLM